MKSAIGFVIAAMFSLGADAQRIADDSTPYSLLQIIGVLHDYPDALMARNAAYLRAHTNFPLSFADVDLDMEAKQKPRRIDTPSGLLAVRDELKWPRAMMASTVDDLVRLKTGVEKCGDPDHPDVPDWRAGDPAFIRNHDTATLTYLEAPCAAETHRVTLTFVYRDGTWRLHRRDIRLGAN